MIRIALVLACCATVCAQVSKPSHRRALLVGVNTYARLAPDRQLRGPAHDAQALGELLRAKFGFDDVRYLLAVDPQPEGVLLATIAGFRAEIDALVERSASGDVVVLFFAGHGSQIPDQPVGDPDHDEDSGFDSTLVLHDSTMQENMIRDDDVRHWLTAIADRGAAVAAIFDSCHSGSVTRGGESRARGLSAESRPSSRVVTRFMPLTESVVTLSACLDDQIANENSSAGYGYFSAALLVALRECGATTTWEEVFDRVRAELSVTSPGQTPRLDAHLVDGKRRLVFSGHAISGRSLPRVFAADDHGASIPVGSVDGVKKGSVFDVHAADATPDQVLSKKGASPIATLVIDHINAADSRGIWRKAPQPGVTTLGIAICVEEPDPEHRLVLDVDPSVDAKLIERLSTLLRKEQPPIGNLLLRRDPTSSADGARVIGRVLPAQTGAGSAWDQHGGILRVPGSGSAEEMLKDLEKLLHFHEVLALASPEPNRLSDRVRMIVKVDPKRREDELVPVAEFATLPDLPRDASGTPFLHAVADREACDHLAIAVKNDTAVELWAYVIDLMPNLKVSVLKGGKQLDQRSILVPPGATTVIAQILVDPVEGPEWLKVLLSYDQVGQIEVLEQEGYRTRGGDDPLGAILQRRLAGHRTRSGARVGSLTTWAVREIGWNVKVGKQ